MKIIVYLFRFGYRYWSVWTYLTEYCVVPICFTLSRRTIFMEVSSIILEGSLTPLFKASAVFIQCELSSKL